MLAQGPYEALHVIKYCIVADCIRVVLLLSRFSEQIQMKEHSLSNSLSDFVDFADQVIEFTWISTFKRLDLTNHSCRGSIDLNRITDMAAANHLVIVYAREIPRRGKSCSFRGEERAAASMQQLSSVSACAETESLIKLGCDKRERRSTASVALPERCTQRTHLLHLADIC